jgi:hypothetical protein
VIDDLRANHAAFITILFCQSLSEDLEIVLVYRMNRSIRKIVRLKNTSRLRYERGKFLHYQLVAQWSSVSVDDLKAILARLIE